MKTDAIVEIELYLRDMLRQVDSSLLEEWERMRDPSYVAAPGEELRPPRPEEPPDVTRDAKAFTAAVRTRLFNVLRAWSTGQDEAALELVEGGEAADGGEPWTPARLRAAREAHRAEHGALRLDPEARNLRHTEVKRSADAWRVEQMLIDTAGLNDWMAEVEVSLDLSRAAGEPVLRLVRLGAIG